MHRVDPRVKIILMAAYSVTLFCVNTWSGLVLCGLAFAASAFLSNLRVGQCLKQLIPLWVILGVSLVANSFALNVAAVAEPTGLGAVSAGAFSSARPVPLIGTFGFVPSGCVRGCYYVLRISLLALASMVVTSTTSSTEFSQALEQFMAPLGRIGVPTQDAASIVSIALRFIPLTFEEFQLVKSAQQSRGAPFETGSVFKRVNAWKTVFIPLFVGMFRKADNLAIAMDARCYGMQNPTRLNEMSFSFRTAALIIGGCACCFAVAWTL